MPDNDEDFKVFKSKVEDKFWDLDEKLNLIEEKIKRLGECLK